MDTLAVRLAVPTIRACSGLAPPSLRNGHHSQFARAYALRAMPGAPNKSATPHSGVALFAAPTSDIGHALYQAWAAFQPRRNSHPASAFRHGTRFVSVLHRRSRPTGNETVPHPSSVFCSMGGRPQRPTIGHRVFPPSILFLVSSPLASQTDVGMKPAASNVVANLLTRHVREAHANSLSSSQNVIQPTAKSVQSPNNSEFCFFRHGFTAW